MMVKANAMTAITINQNDVGSRGNVHRERLASDLVGPVDAGVGVATAEAGPSGTVALGSGRTATSTGGPAGWAQMSGCCGPRSQTDPFSDTGRT